MKAFFDTNILVYAQTTGPKGILARRLLTADGVISVQVLNEFSNVMRKKSGKSWPEIKAAIADIEAALADIRPISVQTHRKAMVICEANQLSFYDALIIAAASEAECGLLWTEDLHNGAKIAGVKIQNPFL